MAADRAACVLGVTVTSIGFDTVDKGTATFNVALLVSFDWMENFTGTVL